MATVKSKLKKSYGEYDGEYHYILEIAISLYPHTLLTQLSSAFRLGFLDGINDNELYDDDLRISKIDRKLYGEGYRTGVHEWAHNREVMSAQGF